MGMMMGKQLEHSDHPFEAERLKTDISQTEFAEKVFGVKLRTYQSWLYGERKPSRMAQMLFENYLKESKNEIF